MKQQSSGLVNKFFLRLERVTTTVNKTFLLLGGGLLLIIMAIIAQDVFRRYYLQDPSGWTLDVSRYLFAYVVFLSLAPALERGSHVKVELIYNLFGRHIQWWLSLFANIMIVFFSAVFFWYLWVRTSNVIADSRHFTAIVSIPMKYVYIIGPVGILQFFLTALVKLFKDYNEKEGQQFNDKEQQTHSLNQPSVTHK